MGSEERQLSQHGRADSTAPAASPTFMRATTRNSGAAQVALGLPSMAMGDEAEGIAAWESALTVEPIRALIRICLAQAPPPQAASG